MTAADLSPSDLATGDRAPRRVLIVSADIGEGHNATGQALEQAIARNWPGCQVSWLDTLALMAPGMGPLARAVYVLQVQRLPWLYEFFFSAIWRHRWFLDSTRRVIGSWCGRRMGPRIRVLEPDVIISTYPLGSAGLAWLRRHRQLTVPIGAWVSDFCPHPYWMYRDLDITYVMHPAAAPVAELAEPGARVAVGALPVKDVFVPAGRAEARASLGLDPQRPAVLLCTGSLAFGGVDRAVTALLAVGPRVQVIAVCGRNEHLRGRLAARGEPPARLRVVGWTDAMQDWMTAADVVVTNAGGMIALEAIACGRPVIMFEPIAGHGRANAALMASSGAALLPASPRELTTVVGRLAADPVARAGAASAARSAAGNRRREDDLVALAAMPGAGGAPPRPVRAEDAFFLHVQAGRVPQQVGAVVTMACQGVELSRLRAAVAVRAGRVPQLRRRLAPARGRWARPRWVEEETVDVARRITEVTRGTGTTPGSLDEIASRFFAAPLDPQQDAWQMLLVHAPPAAAEQRSAIMVKVHHALGDSYTIISALSGLFDPAGGSHPRGVARSRPAAARAGAVLGLPGRVTRVVRGLIGMALAGPAPRTRLTGENSPGRRFASVSLPARAVTITARRLGGSPADLVLALVAEALGRLYATRGEPVDGRSVRVMVPHTLRAARAAPRPARPRVPPPGESADARLPGNHTAGLLLDLPIGPVPLAERVGTIRMLWRARLRRGDVGASAVVLRATKLLPAPLQRAFARRCYTARRFNLIVSVFPGVRQPTQLLGAQIAEVYPVLALANGVGLAIGAMTWGKSLSIGLLADEALVPDVGVLADEIKRAFAAAQRAAHDAAGLPAAPPAADGAGHDRRATVVPDRVRLAVTKPHRRRVSSTGQRR